MRDEVEWRGARLEAIRDLTPDIRLLAIEPSGPFVPTTPGSHIQVAVQIGERADVRSYSIVGPCTDGLYRIAVKLLPDTRGGSAYMWSLRPGAQLTISTPRNHFELTRGLPQYLLLAGGIGVTPIYTMALALAEAGADVAMLYACRTGADLAFGAELAERLGDRLQVFIDADGARPDLQQAIAGLVPGGEFLVCGPIGLLEAAKRAWADNGRPVGQLRFETFGSSGRYASEPFLVNIPRLGRQITVPRNQTMLEALEAAGVAMISDCRRGECGLCALHIIETNGLVDHRDVFFSAAQKDANAKLCTCVSRMAGGSITVDVADRFS